MTIIDLSVTVDTTTAGPPPAPAGPTLTRHHRGPGFWQLSTVEQSLHLGSHIDAPLHCYAGGATTAEIPLDRVCGTATVLDCTGVGADEPVTVGVLERAAGPLREGDIAVLATGWSDRMWGSFPDYYTRSPFLEPEAAEWLVARRPAAVAFDFFEEHCARFPDFTSEEFVCHRILLGAGIPLLEQMTAIGAVGRDRFTLHAPFYKLADCDGALARFYATV